MLKVYATIAIAGILTITSCDTSELEQAAQDKIESTTNDVANDLANKLQERVLSDSLLPADKVITGLQQSIESLRSLSKEQLADTAVLAPYLKEFRVVYKLATPFRSLTPAVDSLMTVFEKELTQAGISVPKPATEGQNN